MAAQRGSSRLFVALTPPPEACRAVAAAVATLGEVPGLRRQPPERWHVTLAFLGDVDDDAVPPLASALGAAVARSSPLRLRLSGGGRFGHRVLWAGVDGDVEGLGRWAAAVTAAARSVGVPVEDRPFRPHLTLARTVGRAAPDLAGPAAALAGVRGAPWTAHEVELVRSHLGAEPRYEVLLPSPMITAGWCAQHP